MVSLMALHGSALLLLICLVAVMSAAVVALFVEGMLISSIIAALSFVVVAAISIWHDDKSLAKKRVLPANAGTIRSLASGLGAIMKLRRNYYLGFSGPVSTCPDNCLAVPGATVLEADSRSTFIRQTEKTPSRAPRRRGGRSGARR